MALLESLSIFVHRPVKKYSISIFDDDRCDEIAMSYIFKLMLHNRKNKRFNQKYFN